MKNADGTVLMWHGHRCPVVLGEAVGCVGDGQIGRFQGQRVANGARSESTRFTQTIPHGHLALFLTDSSSVR